MATLVGFILSFLLAGFFQIASGVPFGPAQILWINWFVDGTIGIALGFGKPREGLMEQPPRSLNQPIISRSVGLRLLYQGTMMAVGILALRVWAEAAYGDEVVAATMSLMAFSFYHIINGLENTDQINQWLICIAVALPLLLTEEILKFVLRHRQKGQG